MLRGIVQQSRQGSDTSPARSALDDRRDNPQVEELQLVGTLDRPPKLRGSAGSSKVNKCPSNRGYGNGVQRGHLVGGQICLPASNDARAPDPRAVGGHRDLASTITGDVQVPERRSAPSGEHGSWTGRQHTGHPARPVTRWPVPERVHATGHRHESPVACTRLDRAPAKTERQQLTPGDNAVLGLGQLKHHSVDGTFDIHGMHETPPTPRPPGPAADWNADVTKASRSCERREVRGDHLGDHRLERDVRRPPER